MAEKESKPQKRFPDFLPDETLDHVRAARKEWEKSIESLFPPGFIHHRKAARREMLLAVRSLIDAALEHDEGSKADSA